MFNLALGGLRGEHTERQASSGSGKVHWNALWRLKIDPPIFKRHNAFYGPSRCRLRLGVFIPLNLISRKNFSSHMDQIPKNLGYKVTLNQQSNFYDSLTNLTTPSRS